MAIHGKNTEILLDGVDASEYFNSVETAISVDSAETTTFKKDWKTHMSGQASATVSGGGFYDPSYLALATALDTVKVLTLAPQGALVAGAKARMAAVRTTSYGETSAIGDAVGFAWAANTDELSFGKYLWPLSELDDADGAGETVTGTSVDDGAATTDGFVAHLHVTAIDGDLDVKIQDSANNSDWDDVTNGAFATADAAGAERIEVSGTLRRYVRVSATISADDSATFAVSLARN